MNTENPTNGEAPPPFTEKQYRDRIAMLYAEMINKLIEEICVKRIEEIEGRVPSLDEVAEHGNKEVSEYNGMALYKWKGMPICEFVPAGMIATGWRNASVKEMTPTNRVIGG